MSKKMSLIPSASMAILELTVVFFFRVSFFAFHDFFSDERDSRPAGIRMRTRIKMWTSTCLQESERMARHADKLLTGGTNVKEGRKVKNKRRKAE